MEKTFIKGFTWCVRQGGVILELQISNHPNILRKVNAILIREFGSMIRTPTHAIKNANKGVRKKEN